MGYTNGMVQDLIREIIKKIEKIRHFCVFTKPEAEDSLFGVYKCDTVLNDVLL